MRKVLVLGGTAWLGRAIAERLVAVGDAVTCLARGDSGQPPAGARFVRSDRTTADPYTAVAGDRWDEIIELAYEPALVTGALEALAATTEHWTLVSSVSVYAGNDEPGADECAAVLEPVDPEHYGQAKAAAERASRNALGDRLLIVRPGLIAGPGDGSDRFSYWVSRLALAKTGPVLTPVTEGRAVQVIEVRDLALWIVSAGRGGLVGVYNATGDEHALAEVLDLAADVAGFDGRMISAPDDWLLENDVRYWAGPRSLPLWLPKSEVPLAQRDNSAFHAAGGVLSDLRQTLLRTFEDEQQRGLSRVRRSGLTRHEELELLSSGELLESSD